MVVKQNLNTYLQKHFVDSYAKGFISPGAYGPALATNKSHFEKSIIKWNPETAQLA
jgi:hypothetical protein